MASCGKNVKDIYVNVVLDVINGVREAFLDEGMDEQILQELRQLWESKLLASKALEGNPYEDGNRQHAHQQPQQPVRLSQSQVQMSTQSPQQIVRAPPAHQQLSASAIHPGSVIAHGVPQSMTLSAQTAANALPAGLLPQQLFFVNPQGQVLLNQQGQVLSVGPQFAMMNPSAQADPNAVTTKQIVQLDGHGDSSSDDDDDDNPDDDDDDNDDDLNDDVDEPDAEEEDPLNSSDDVSDSDPTEVFDAENVIVCQFDKINRSKNRWKFQLKDGIMSINGRDQLFQKASGDAEW